MRRDGVRIGRGGRVAVAAVGTVAALALGLSACGGGDDDDKPALGQGSSSANSSMPSGSISSAPMSSASSMPSSMPGSMSPGSSAGGPEADKAPAQIVADVQRAVQAARSVHVAGSLNNVAVNLVVTSDGKSKGTITQNGRTQQLVILGPQEVYGTTSASGTFLRLPADAASKANEAFVKATLVDGLLNTQSAFTKVGTSTVDGQAAVVLRSQKTGAELAVANDSTHPYAVAVKAGSTGSGEVAFTDWDQDVTITAPTTAGSPTPS